jgi:uncharacterized SAM-binding protein YcdF (DUF218 family)
MSRKDDKHGSGIARGTTIVRGTAVTRRTVISRGEGTEIRAERRRDFRRLFGVARGFVRIVAGLSAGSLIAILFSLPSFIETIRVQSRRSLASADAIVVLTGAAERIGDGVALLQQRRGRRLLISGINEQVQREDLVRLNPTLRPLLACCVDFGYAARTTVGNALEARDWAKRHAVKSLILVTSNYHIPRARAELANALPGVAIHTHAVPSDAQGFDHWWQRPATLRLLVVEYLKYIAAILRMAVEGEPGSLAGQSLNPVPVRP